MNTTNKPELTSKDNVKLAILSVFANLDGDGFTVLTASSDYNKGQNGKAAWVFKGNKGMKELINHSVPNARIDIDGAAATLNGVVTLPAKSYLTFDAKVGKKGESYTASEKSADGKRTEVIKQYKQDGINCLNTAIELSAIAKAAIKDLNDKMNLQTHRIATEIRMGAGYNRPTATAQPAVEPVHAEVFADEQIAE